MLIVARISAHQDIWSEYRFVHADHANAIHQERLIATWRKWVTCAHGGCVRPRAPGQRPVNHCKALAIIGIVQCGLGAWMTAKSCGHQAAIAPEGMRAPMSSDMAKCQIGLAKQACQHPGSVIGTHAQENARHRDRVSVQRGPHQARGNVSSAKWTARRIVPKPLNPLPPAVRIRSVPV